MNLKINEDKLKIKYILGNYPELDGYPTTEDVLYSIIQYAIDANNIGEFRFSDKFVKRLIKLDEDKIESILKSMVEEGLIEVQRETNTKIVYKIKKNIFE